MADAPREHSLSLGYLASFIRTPVAAQPQWRASETFRAFAPRKQQVRTVSVGGARFTAESRCSVNRVCGCHAAAVVQCAAVLHVPLTIAAARALRCATIRDFAASNVHISIRVLIARASSSTAGGCFPSPRAQAERQFYNVALAGLLHGLRAYAFCRHQQS